MQSAGRNKLPAPGLSAETLLGFSVHRVFSAASTVFLQFHPVRVIPAIFLRCVIAFLTFSTRKGDDRSDVFLFSSHDYTPAWSSGRNPFNSLRNNLGDDTRANGQTAFANGEF